MIAFLYFPFFHRWIWLWFAFISFNEKEKEVKWLEAVVAEMRGELNHMKRTDKKQKAKLRKVQKKISKSRKRLAANYARINLHNDAILHLLDGNWLVSIDLIYSFEKSFHHMILFLFCYFICRLNFPDVRCLSIEAALDPNYVFMYLDSWIDKKKWLLKQRRECARLVGPDWLSSSLISVDFILVSCACLISVAIGCNSIFNINAIDFSGFY